MKDKSLGYFKLKLLFEIILRVLICFVFYCFFIYLVDGPANDLLANTMVAISPELYYTLRNYKDFILALVLCAAIVITAYSCVCKVTKYITILTGSINKMFQKDEELIVLPKEFGDIENQLNSIKYESFRNEQIAKESEQRKNDLVVYLAHDLKTPLTSVIGYLTLLYEEPQISQELQKKYLGISIEKAERLEELINEFFEITRFNLQNISLETSRINLSLMLSQLADEFYPLFASKQLSCTVQALDDLYIMGDANKLERVFDNILRNAINYSNENSYICIKVEQHEEKVQISFQNTGSQIPKEKLQYIFEKFYRLDSARSSRTGGAGLGLAIAKQIVELHHGTITASSDEQFTEFAILLPSCDKM